MFRAVRGLEGGRAGALEGVTSGPAGSLWGHVAGLDSATKYSVVRDQQC